MNEFEPHDYFKADDQGYISRKVFIEHVRNSYDHMRELSALIKGYDQTIDTYLDRWDQNLESLDDSVIGLLHEWIDDSTFATIINKEIFKTKADQIDLDEVTAQLTQKATKEELSNVLGGSPKDVFGTLTELQTSYATGVEGVFLVEENGHIYSWDGTNWVDRGQYQSMGVADRSVTMKKTSFINTGVNLFDSNDSDIIDGQYINSEQPTEVFMEDTRLFTSGFVEAESNDTIIVPVVLNIITRFMGAYYDRNKQFVSGIKRSHLVESDGIRTITIPSDPNIKYVRFNGRQGTERDTFMIIKGTSYPSEYIPYRKPFLDNKIALNDTQREEVGDITSGLTYVSKWDNKKVNFMGDSITYGTNTTKAYHQFLVENIPLAVARNYGVNGSNISGTSNAMNDRVLNMDKDVDLICVFGGTNDFKNNIPLGELYTDVSGSRTVVADTATFYGSLHTLCQNLINTFQGKQYALFTPIHREVYDGQKTSLQPNGIGLFLEDYVKAIKEIGKHYAIPVLDLYSISGLQPNEPVNKTLYFTETDGLHPKLEGHEVLASKIEAFLNTI